MKKFILLAAILGGAVLVTQPVFAGETVTPKLLGQQSQFCVAIDAGHGGQDKGDVVAGVAAKDLNLLLARKLKKELEVRGIRVVMTRADDSYITLLDRTTFVGRQNVDCFVALRADDNSKYPKLPPYSVSYQRSESALLANFLNNNLKEAANASDNPLKPAKMLNYYVLRKIAAPAAMVSGDLTLLKNPKAQDKLIQSLADGIADFSNLKGRSQRI